MEKDTIGTALAASRNIVVESVAEGHVVRRYATGDEGLLRERQQLHDPPMSWLDSWEATWASTLALTGATLGLRGP